MPTLRRRSGTQEWFIQKPDDIIEALRAIVDGCEFRVLRWNRAKLTVDLFSASAVLAVYDNLKPTNQDKFRRTFCSSKTRFSRGVCVSFSLLSPKVTP